MASDHHPIGVEEVLVAAVPYDGRISADVPAEGEKAAEPGSDAAKSASNHDLLLQMNQLEAGKLKDPANKQKSLDGRDDGVRSAGKAYSWLVLRAVVLIVLLMWMSLPAFWGALSQSATLTTNLDAWFIDRDDSRIGHALWSSFVNSTIPGPQLGWRFVDPRVAGTDEQIVDAVINGSPWVAVVIQANATLNLGNARRNGDVTYDPTSAITVYYAQARHEVATGNYIVPITTQLLQDSTTAWATGTAQRYFAQITGTGGDPPNGTALHMLALAPQTISPAVSWNMVNVRPYTAPAAQAVTLVGNIFLCIFAFMVTMANFHARPLIASQLSLYTYIALRIAAPLIAYIPISLSYTLVSLAFDLPLNTKYSDAGGFFLMFIYVYLGMAALGLALEAVITLVRPIYAPYFLFILIIYNVSPVLLPGELQSPFFAYGIGFPIFNLSQALRTIMFDTHSYLGRNAGVIIAWIALSCGTIFLFTWYTHQKARAMAARVA